MAKFEELYQVWEGRNCSSSGQQLEGRQVIRAEQAGRMAWH
jgi:hypothetical protein